MKVVFIDNGKDVVMYEPGDMLKPKKVCKHCRRYRDHRVVRLIVRPLPRLTMHAPDRSWVYETRREHCGGFHRIAGYGALFDEMKGESDV